MSGPPPYGPPPWAAPRPKRPTYRESRPVRWWTVLLGVAAGFVYYVLLALVSWSLVSFSVVFVLGMLVAGALTWVLLSRGDRGAAVGLAAVTGLALAVVTTVLGVDVYVLGDGVF